MLTKTTTHRQRYWLKHVEAADLSDSTIAQYAGPIGDTRILISLGELIGDTRILISLSSMFNQ